MTIFNDAVAMQMYKTNPTDNDVKIANQIRKMFRCKNASEVSNVVVDDVFGNVTATVRGRKNIACGFIEEYCLT